MEDKYLFHKVPNAIRSKHDALVLVGGHLETQYLGVRHLPQYERASHGSLSRARARCGGSGHSVGSHA